MASTQSGSAKKATVTSRASKATTSRAKPTTKSTTKASPTKKAAAKTAKTTASKSRSTSSAGRSPAAPKETCFVMSPFGGWYDQYYAEIFSPAISDAGLEPCRADDLYRPSAIVHDIWEYVKSARVMLADLTEKNPNVFYELGLAHALDKPVVLLARTMEDVPFDLRALRVITYEIAAPNWGEILRASVSTALREVIEAPDSAVLAPFRREANALTVEQQVEDESLERLQREMNLLRAEIRRRPTVGRVSQDPIEPDEARRLIQHYVEEGLPLTMIVDRIQPLGPPASWVRREYQTIAARNHAIKDEDLL